LPHSLVRIDVADVSADGNARHADERIAGSEFCLRISLLILARVHGGYVAFVQEHAGSP
jgi:hypothetical protein